MTPRIATALRGGLDWSARLAWDAAAITERLPASLTDLHTTVVERAAASDAASLILSGSTARAARTAISDLDYHLVGRPIDLTDLSQELDLHVLTSTDLSARVLEGDDFVHWSLRFGLIVFDHGPARDGVSLIAERGLWPDVGRKRSHAVKSLDLAGRFVATGDRDGALVQVRTALSLAARAYLLGLGVFPLSRVELPGQLREAERADACDALSTCINAEPTLDELERAVVLGASLLAGG